MGIAGTVRRGRLAAERIMLDTIEVSYPTGATVKDTNTGREIPVYEVEFETICQFQTATLKSEDLTVAARREVVDRMVVKMPVDRPQVRTDALITCTATGGPSDPRLVGRKFLVAGPHNKSYATATRLELKEYVE